MTTVSQLTYVRSNYEEVKAKCDAIFKQMRQVQTVEQLLPLREQYLDIVDHYSSMSGLAEVRFTQNTRDEFYNGEMEYYDEYSPLFAQIIAEYTDIMLSSPLRPQMEKVINPKIYKLMECFKKANPPEIVAEKQEENTIRTEYSVLISQLKVMLNGEEVTLSAARGKLDDKDREVRKAAAYAIGNCLKEAGDKLDDIFERLVKIRHKMATKLGYENYIPLGYYNMQRVDYNREMVEKFRQNVVSSIVPATTRIKEKLRKELGIEKITYYDDNVYSKKGNPRTILNKEQIFEEASKMYHEMEPRLGKFFDSMVQTEAFDVDARDGKMSGGYCTAFPLYKQVFIFANFNGSADDIGTMTHEFGHAYAFARALECPDARELDVGGMETAECHSMSMEVFCSKFMDRFMGSDSDNFHFVKTAADLCFIPYGCMVDEFQHVVYENPNLTPKQRKDEWLKLEKKYRPFLSYEGIPYLEEGTRWQIQGHIFESPFYYIDYCLAQTVAFGFMVASMQDYKDAFARYLKLVETGGTTSFAQLILDAGIAYPFGEGTLGQIASTVEEILK